MLAPDDWGRLSQGTAESYGRGGEGGQRPGIKNNWVVVSIFFIFTPYLGKISNLTDIFQMGWFNHQPEYILGMGLHMAENNL